MAEPQIELLLIMTIDGRPLWRVSRTVVKKEATLRMDEPEYLAALDAAGKELMAQIVAYKKRAAEKKALENPGANAPQ